MLNRNALVAIGGRHITGARFQRRLGSRFGVRRKLRRTRTAVTSLAIVPWDRLQKPILPVGSHVWMLSVQAPDIVRHLLSKHILLLP